MKRLSLFFTFSLLLTACNSLSVIDSDVLSKYPELEGPATTWQAMVDSAEAQDCTAFLDTMRLTLNLTEEVCPDVFAYFENTPIVDWQRTDWSTTGGKAKIYEMGGGSITSFIHNEADDSWRSDELFWE